MPQQKRYDRYPVRPLDGGQNKERNPTLLRDSEASSMVGIDLDRRSLKAASGAVKFNNQRAPRSCVESTVDNGSVLANGLNLRAPLRGYGYMPYNPRYDLGGDFNHDGGGLGVRTYHAQRGRSFELAVSFELPETEKLYSQTHADASGPKTSPMSGQVHELDQAGSFDEGLEDCFIILQKGGDRLTPMSWALGVVNTGQRASDGSDFDSGTTLFETLTGKDPGSRQSSYALVFMWFDGPGWGEFVPDVMRYSTASGIDVGVSGEFCTMAYRAVVFEKWIQPGVRYHVALQLGLDTGTPGTPADPTTTWNGDGTLRLQVWEDGRDELETFQPSTQTAHVWKGPVDSIDYLVRYGIRYSGRDAMFAGLGYRVTPYNPYGFVPCGYDSASVNVFGNSMVPYGSTAFPVGWNLSCSHSASAASISVNQAYLNQAAFLGRKSPTGLDSAVWNGLGSSPSTDHNLNALRNYWMAVWTGGSLLGGWRARITSFASGGASFDAQASGVSHSWSNRECAVLAFRWNQRPIRFQGIRVFAEPRDYADPRTVLSLRTETLVDDSSEPGLAELQAYWPCTDAGGGVLKERMAGSDGYLAPFTLGSSENGSRGKRRIFLSGEGEALVLDLSENPVFQREMRHAMQDGESGIAIEATFVLPEAYYAVEQLVGSFYFGKHAPHILSWDVKSQADDGFAQTPSHLLRLTHKAAWPSAVGIFSAKAPMGFGLEVQTQSDQESGGSSIIVPLHDGTGRLWAEDAPWVGKLVTIQIGLHPTGVEDEYDVYMALLPKADFFPEGGDGSSQEFVYGERVTVRKKDLVRSVITIGGAFDPEQAAAVPLGYSELNCRMILDEVRVFAVSAPGGMPAVTTSPGGSVPADRDGKLSGGKALPARVLDLEDLLLPVGPDGLEAGNVTEGSPTITSPSQTSFFDADPQDTLDAVRGTMVMAAGDLFDRRKKESLGDLIPEFYFVEEATGTALVLRTPYADASRMNAALRSFRLAGYSDFGDDLEGRELTLGRGSTFLPSVTTAEDVTISADFFRNRCPLGTHWKLRVYSPLWKSSAVEIRPRWVRGVAASRQNPVLGMTSINRRVIAAASGSLFQVDDRWRPDGPTPALLRSLEIRARRHPREPIALPLADDFAFFYPPDESSQLPFALQRTFLSAGSIVLDGWVRLDDLFQYQTLLWVGSDEDDPSRMPGGLDFRLNYILRFTYGRPQLVIGSTATYDGTNRPPEGVFLATARDAIPVGRWVHVRWFLAADMAGGTILQKPACAINGKLVSVELNAIDDGVAGPDDWLRIGTIADPGVDAIGILGCARDSYRARPLEVESAEGTVQGRRIQPDRVHGFLHALGGRFSGLAVATVDEQLGAGVVDDFDPYAIDYGSAAQQLFAAIHAGAQDGRGHKIEDTSVNALVGVIRSHPAISLFHEMGDSGERVNFATFQSEVFAANGGRVVVEEEGRACFAGLEAPTTKPKFAFDRKPVWTPNVFVASTVGNTPGNQAGSSAGERINHFRTNGNLYLRQAWHEEMRWDFDPDTNQASYFAFKCYIKPESVAGRIPLYSQRNSLESGGPFVEIRDGRVAFGFYDVYLKREVSIETNVPVVRPGAWHYIYVRKMFPGARASGNKWDNGVLFEQQALSKDTLVVRELLDDPAVTDAGLGAGVVDMPYWIGHGQFASGRTGRMAVSFTRDLTLAGTTATGRVSDAVFAVGNYNGNVNGRIQSMANSFTDDMGGMLWQWDDATGDANLYRVVEVESAGTVLIVRDAVTGALPDFSGAQYDDARGAVFSGVNLVASEGFDQARNPDPASYDIELFGSALVNNPLNGVNGYRGEFDSVAWAVAKAPAGSFADVDVFEDASALGGTLVDDLYVGATEPAAFQLASATPFGENEVDGFTFGAVHTRGYGGPVRTSSTQPNEELEVALDVAASANAKPATLERNQNARMLAGARRVAVTFYDPEQDQESNPGPLLDVLPSEEDRTNPSSSAALVLSDLPVSSRSGVHRRIYLTALGGATPLRVAEIEDNSSSSVALEVTESRIARGSALRFDNASPPRAKVIASGLQRMFYANFPGQPDGVLPSRPFRPRSITNAGFFVLDSGDDSPITAMAAFKGRILAFKRNKLWEIGLVQGTAVTSEISAGVGAVSQQSIFEVGNVLGWIDESGPYVFAGTGMPIPINSKLEEVFEAEFDPKYLPLVAAAMNRRRRQIIFTMRRAGALYPSERIGMRYVQGLPANDDRNFHVAPYAEPAITAITEVDSLDGGPRRLVAGTQEGFFAWMDQTDTRLVMLGPEPAIWGDSLLSSSAGAAVGAVVIPISSGSLDLALAGPAGAVARWLDGSGSEQRALVIGAVGSSLLVDRPIEAAVPAGATLTLGAQLPRWKSRAFEFTTPEAKKKMLYLDVTRAPKASGTLMVSVYRDLSATPDVTKELDLTVAAREVPILEVQQAHFVEVELFAKTPAVDLDFELFDLVWRYVQTEEG